MKLNRNLTDQEILEKIKSKSDPNQAISQLYSQHYGMLEHYIIQNSGSADDAADLIQEVMLVFVKLVSEEKYRGEASVKSFLYSICKNLWITELRKRKSTEARHDRYEGEKDQLESDISTQISKNENLKFVMDLFNKLGEKCKQLLTLFYFEELPIKEITEKLEFSSEQVLRNKKYKCLQNLTDQVKSSPALSKNLQKALRHE
jgi:RNA polymerase sigma factor (sigma-70 family)